MTQADEGCGPSRPIESPIFTSPLPAHPHMNLFLHLLPSVVSGMVLAAVLWVGTQLVQVSTDVAVIKYQTATFERRLQALELIQKAVPR